MVTREMVGKAIANMLCFGGLLILVAAGYGVYTLHDDHAKVEQMWDLITNNIKQQQQQRAQAQQPPANAGKTE